MRLNALSPNPEPMKAGKPVRRRRPTFEQELLLRAALSEGGEALSCWRRWNECMGLARIDGGSVRLLPLLYRNLNSHAPEDPSVVRLKEEYVHTWFNNELLFHELASRLRSFHAAGIETLVLKGAALALNYYEDVGLRPMSDVDVLVQPEKALSAIKLLHEAGWKSIYGSPEALITYQHAVEFSDGRGHRLDLHWRALWDGRQGAGDEEFWEGAVPMEIDCVRTGTLNPADQLLHVCVHGTAWSDPPTLRWVADAVMIMRTAGAEIDWDRLVRQTRARRVMLPMRDALSYLQSFLGAPVPAGVLERIRDVPASRLERALYRTRTGRNRWLRRLNVLYYWFCAWRLSPHPRPHQKLSEFLRYLKCFCGAKFFRAPGKKEKR